MSDFGKGLTYCLGLFLAHAEKTIYESLLDKHKNYELWFNGAADHLFEIETKQLKEPLKSRVEEFQDKCLNWRLAFDGRLSANKEDFNWAIKEAKNLLLEIDKYFGIETEKGEWE